MNSEFLKSIKHLPPDFKMSRYGVDVRLVKESDASFILSLRSDKWLTRFIHPTENDEDKQRVWIRDYKVREKDGKEYYFIYSVNGESFGLNRIYNIVGETCTGGSWLCKPGTEVEYVVATTLIHRDILFEIMGIKEDNFDVRKGNHKVQKFHEMTGCIKTGETELDILYKLTPERYYSKKQKIINLLGLS